MVWSHLISTSRKIMFWMSSALYVYIYIIHVHVRVCIRVCVRVRIHVHVYVYAYATYVYVYKHISVPLFRAKPMDVSTFAENMLWYQTVAETFISTSDFAIFQIIIWYFPIIFVFDLGSIMWNRHGTLASVYETVNSHTENDLFPRMADNPTIAFQVACSYHCDHCYDSYSSRKT